MALLIGGETNAGQLLRVWQVSCGRCHEIADSGVGALAWGEKLLRSHGWVKTRRYGWVCEACATDRHGDAD